MKQAVIDIGSNSIRLTLYEVGDQGFKILFREKHMAGLAGYVDHGVLSPDGIARACDALLDFSQTLELLGIRDAAVFATASLRNIENPEQALCEIRAATGFDVQILSGEEEALLGYTGAMYDLDLTGGAFVDIGGASTEVVTFEDGRVLESVSFPVGSLSLYRRCVKKILPGPGSLRRIESVLDAELDHSGALTRKRRSPLICVGGTARAVWKLAKKLGHLPEDSRSITRAQLESLAAVLCRADRQATDLILRLEPDRIHTLIPGLLILQHIMKRFDADELVFSSYGVREGYLCQTILRPLASDTATPKAGS